MENYPWPGNVRELENTIQRASVLATSDVLLPKDIPLGMVGGKPASTAEGDAEDEDAPVVLANAG